jgi:ABC-2 type transport system ATP-binding protein
VNVAAPDIAVAVDGVTKCFGATRAVDAVDLQIEGGVVGVLGPNGAGKTTLLRMLATVLAPDGGTVRLGGLDPRVPTERLAIRLQLGYLPQEPGLYRGFTAFDLVDYVAVLKHMTDRPARREEVRRVLGLVGVTDVMHKKIRTLSGGTRQRVALAAAMLGDPRLLVLDEPAAGLDPEHRLQLRSVLSAAGRTGTVVVSTHQTDEVAAFCRYVVVMIAGRIRFIGAPSDLAAVAAGCVWIDEGRPESAHDAGSVQSWITADGHVRHLGEPPPGAELVEPTIDDGYLLLTHAEMSLR